MSAIASTQIDAEAKNAPTSGRLFFLLSARQQLHGSERSSFRPILVFDPMPAALLAQMLAQQLSCFRMEQADMLSIPLHCHAAADPAWWRAVVGRFHFDAAVQMYRSFTVLVIAKRFQGQRLERRFFFGEHRGDLSLGGAMDSRIGPAFFPAIQIGLGFLQTLEAKPLQWRFLGMADTGFHLAFSIRILNAARHGDGAVMCQHVAVQRVERWIVDVG
jgi:hypothetical protein